MKQKTKLMQIIIIIVVSLFVISAVSYYADYSSLPTLSKVGSRGEEVKQIQKSLQNKGIYSGAVDGIYGKGTQAAVKKFQQQSGLSSDGVAGPQTLKALGVGGSTNDGGGGQASNNSGDETLLARMISAEARGEPYEGQVAVGAVILNRVEHPSFPDTLSGVMYQPGAFTAVVDGQFNEAISESAHRAAKDALNGQDPSGGAIYYYNPKKTSNKWMRTRPVITTIGDHLFCS